jgi:polyhydroxyalkanoate synthesis regulator phasin
MWRLVVRNANRREPHRYSGGAEPFVTGNREELRGRVAAYVRDYGMSAVEASKITDEVVREIDEEDEDWEADMTGRVEAARHRLRDADLFRRGFTLDQLEPMRLHYSR